MKRIVYLLSFVLFIGLGVLLAAVPNVFAAVPDNSGTATPCQEQGEKIVCTFHIKPWGPGFKGVYSYTIEMLGKDVNWQTDPRVQAYSARTGKAYPKTDQAMLGLQTGDSVVITKAKPAQASATALEPTKPADKIFLFKDGKGPNQVSLETLGLADAWSKESGIRFLGLDGQEIPKDSDPTKIPWGTQFVVSHETMVKYGKTVATAPPSPPADAAKKAAKKSAEAGQPPAADAPVLRSGKYFFEPSYSQADAQAWFKKVQRELQQPLAGTQALMDPRGGPDAGSTDTWFTKWPPKVTDVAYSFTWVVVALIVVGVLYVIIHPAPLGNPPRLARVRGLDIKHRARLPGEADEKIRNLPPRRGAIMATDFLPHEMQHAWRVITESTNKFLEAFDTEIQAASGFLFDGVHRGGLKHTRYGVGSGFSWEVRVVDVDTPTLEVKRRFGEAFQKIAPNLFDHEFFKYHGVSNLNDGDDRLSRVFEFHFYVVAKLADVLQKYPAPPRAWPKPVDQPAAATSDG